MMTSNRFVNPFHKLLEHISPLGTQYRKDVQHLRSYCRQIIQERRLHPMEAQDLLSLFMNSNSEEMDMNDEFLADSLLNFIIAGRDTTAQALSWAFFYLSKHPQVVQTAREELNRVIKVDSFPEYDQLKSLEYIKAIFLETLRLSPSVPMNIRTCINDDVWPDGTNVPAGTMVHWSSFVIHRNPNVWGEDAQEFKPERWLQMTNQPSQFKFSAFHGGPRVCLGRSMAELEGTFVLACLLKRFNVRVIHPEQVLRVFSLTNPMKNGLMVELARR
jgi:cytochrome P450